MTIFPEDENKAVALYSSSGLLSRLLAPLTFAGHIKFFFFVCVCLCIYKE